jgi:hypothetical protein
VDRSSGELPGEVPRKVGAEIVVVLAEHEGDGDVQGGELLRCDPRVLLIELGKEGSRPVSNRRQRLSPPTSMPTYSIPRRASSSTSTAKAFTLTASDGRVIASPGADPRASAGITGKLRDFFAAAKGDTSAAQRLTVTGDRAATKRLLTAVTGAMTTAR